MIVGYNDFFVNLILLSFSTIVLYSRNYSEIKKKIVTYDFLLLYGICTLTLPLKYLICLLTPTYFTIIALPLNINFEFKIFYSDA